MFIYFKLVDLVFKLRFFELYFVLGEKMNRFLKMSGIIILGCNFYYLIKFKFFIIIINSVLI